jgi:hypothetical protein
MATLQAARAMKLGLPQDSAYSWGLNRAIFYAAAKRGFKGGVESSRGKAGTGGTSEKKINNEEFYLGTEKAYVDKQSSNDRTLYFTIGELVQTPNDFEKQVVSRFGSHANFEKAWEEALKIIGKYDTETLESQQEFYEKVYKPRRDSLSKDWNDRFADKKVASSQSKH